MKRTAWTPAADAELRRMVMAGREKSDVIALALGRSASAVRTRAYALDRVLGHQLVVNDNGDKPTRIVGPYHRKTTLARLAAAQEAAASQPALAPVCDCDGLLGLVVDEVDRLSERLARLEAAFDKLLGLLVSEVR